MGISTTAATGDQQGECREGKARRLGGRRGGCGARFHGGLGQAFLRFFSRRRAAAATTRPMGRVPQGSTVSTRRLQGITTSRQRAAVGAGVAEAGSY